MLNRVRRLAVVSSILVWAGGAAAASGELKLKHRLDLTLSTSLWSGDRDLSDAGPLAYPQVNVKISQITNAGFGIVAEGYAGHAKPFDGRPAKDSAVLRELYVTAKAGPVSLKAGSQIITWGRADVFNPTDNVSSQNYTQLVADDAAQKIGLLTASLTWRVGNTSVQGVWQPSFRASTLPLPDLPGLRYEERAPADSVSQRGGVRVDTVGEKLSWSLSYFRGPSKRPNLAISPTRLSQGVIDLDHPLVSIFGADGELISGRLIIRGEAAYQRYKGSGSNALASRESFLHGVLGVERSFGDYSLFMQGTYQQVFDYFDVQSVTGVEGQFALANAMVNEEVYRVLPGLGAGFRYATSDLRWITSIEAGWYPGISDVALRPRLRYQIEDSLTAWGGADFFAGESDGRFGRLGANNTFFFGLTQAVSLAR